MNARDRYLAVYSDSQRKYLDRVPIFVQNIKEEFIAQHQNAIFENYKGKKFNNYYVDAPLALGFDAIFAPFPLSLKTKPIKVTNDKGQSFKIGEDGQAIKRTSTYYAGGHINSLEVLNELINNTEKINNIELIQKTIARYNLLSPEIFPVLMISGIFDRVWQAMGMELFSRHFRQKSKLYEELVKFYAEHTLYNLEQFIEATENNGGVINILDDVAFKGRPMISPERFEQDYSPHYKKITNLISDAGMIPQIHSDGDVTKLVPSLTRAGFRGLQGWEGGADPFYINDHFPDFVVIGFGDVSEVLPFGTQEQVEQHVKKLMEALKENRHFVIGPSTVIVKEIPLENVRAFMRAVKKYGAY